MRRRACVGGRRDSHGGGSSTQRAVPSLAHNDVESGTCSFWMNRPSCAALTRCNKALRRNIAISSTSPLLLLKSYHFRSTNTLINYTSTILRFHLQLQWSARETIDEATPVDFNPIEINLHLGWKFNGIASMLILRYVADKMSITDCYKAWRGCDQSNKIVKRASLSTIIWTQFKLGSSVSVIFFVMDHDHKSDEIIWILLLTVRDLYLTSFTINLQ